MLRFPFGCDLSLINTFTFLRNPNILLSKEFLGPSPGAQNFLVLIFTIISNYTHYGFTFIVCNTEKKVEKYREKREVEKILLGLFQIFILLMEVRYIHDIIYSHTYLYDNILF